MNINDVLIRVLKKNNELSEQILNRNEEEDKSKHTLEIKACEAPSLDQEIAEKFQDEEWEISNLEQPKQVEINCQTEYELWQSDELKKIEMETQKRKSELERLRAAARELMKAEEEEIAQLKRALAAKEDNRSRQEDKVYQEEEDEEWETNFVVDETSSEEELELPVTRSSTAKKNASKRRQVVPGRWIPQMTTGRGSPIGVGN